MKTVNKNIMAAALLLITVSAFSQGPKAVRMYAADSPSAPSGVQPFTTVEVILAIEKETVVAGPYARYAQKYLGVTAPFADKANYSITRAWIDYMDPDKDSDFPVAELPDTGLFSQSHINLPDGFTRALPDKTSLTEKSTEDMARDAANTIFTLRKRRFDLITGEAGEHVYGEGLKAAIEEMARIENEYLALFLGKQTVEREIRKIRVIPREGQTNYVVCRFSTGEGLVPVSDVSGRPVALIIRPEGVAGSPARKDTKNIGYFRVAGFAECMLMDDTRELAKETIPIYQLGTTVTADVSLK